MKEKWKAFASSKDDKILHLPLLLESKYQFNISKIKFSGKQSKKSEKTSSAIQKVRAEKQPELLK